MARLIAFLVLLGAVLYVAQAVAPLLVLAAVGLVLLAWKRPATLEPVIAWPRLARVPERLRATPMRFAGSVAFATFLLIGFAMPMAAALRGEHANPSPGAALDRGSASATPRPAETPEPTPRPTRRATPAPATPEPTPTPTPEPTAAFGEEPTGPTQAATVTSVTDGDTIRVLLDGQDVPLRYIGIDAPETQAGVEWMGREATDANAALVAGREVILETDVSDTDQYGRLLRHVWVEVDGAWVLVGLELVRQGVAQVSTFPPDVKYVNELLLPAQAAAREAGIGLWGVPPTPAPTPAPIVPLVPQPPSSCEPSYPDFCIAIGASDLDCGEIQWRRFTVRWDVPTPDPHGFDGDGDGIGCES